MELLLQRQPSDRVCTLGRLSIDGVPECYTLELPIGDGGKGCAIPAGRYPVTVAYSPHFGHTVPHVNNVLGRSEIEIHNGNVPANTDGCILVGQRVAVDSIADSVLALAALQPKIAGALARGEQAYLTVLNAGANPTT